jgi:hypothetical protein
VVLSHGRLVGRAFLVAALAVSASVSAQDTAQDSAHVRDTTHIDPVLSIGNTTGVNGLRLNVRDSRLDRVNGINLTVWLPSGGGRGVINGMALGVPASGGRTLNGLGVGIGGFAMSHDVNGVLISGLGSGVGGTVTGVTVSGLAMGSGQRLRGLNVAGLGVVAGQSLWGLSIAGLAAGSAGQANGITIAGVAAGAPIVRGILIAGVATGGVNVTGAMIAPVYVRIADGQLTGGSIGAVNDVRGELHGISIGIFNYARSLHGLQLGLLNLAGNNHGLTRLLPIVNFHP